MATADTADTAGTEPIRQPAPSWMDPAMAANPQPTYRKLREQSPILRMDGHVVLTRWADIDQALRRPEAFSSNWSAVDLGNVRPLIPLQIDPPNHVKYRRLLDPLFAPRKLARLEPEVAKLVNDLIDAFAGRGECDFSDEFAVLLPSQVFLTLLGLPLDDLDLFLKMKDGIIRPWQAVGRPQDSAEAKAYQREMAAAIYDYFGRVLDEREQERRNDWLSMFLDASVDGVNLSREEILDICLLFLIAGLDTVTDSLECFFAYLAQHPSQRALLVKDPSMIPSAVEEMLRWESPVSTIVRVAVTDTEVRGCPIHAGEQVGLMIGSGNTDAERFDNPDLVDLARDPNPHIAFGGGVHRCLGSHLARLELRVALREWHARIPDYSLRSGAELTYTPAMRSVEHLPLVFEPLS